MQTRPDARPDARPSPDPGLAIEVRGLRRSYRTAGGQPFEAVRGVDLEVQRGRLVALLGTNGAGKTSTLEVVEGLAEPDAGTVRVLGLDPRADRAEVRRRTGVLLQASGFSGDLTVAETLRMWASTVTDPRPTDDVLGLLDLGGRAGTRVVALSGGERRRLDLACTLLGRPEVLLLDEPTTGLDPESRRAVWDLVRDLRDEGASVLLTTHHLEEAEELADALAIMHEGVVVRSGTVAEVVSSQPSTVRFAAPGHELPPLAAARPAGRGAPGTTTLETDDLQATLADLLAWAGRHGVRLEGLEARSATLESAFLAIAREGATR
ncbi:ABC transporter ATP-binding protein [Nocardioides dongkuii]|uniref:ABC transporter ATP-binding protein n=1 Tax=Nocardioides dongkuii TaxID=2760089 RepID=UPI0015FC309B|nr:ABC transporter ATP-binding protein [Nocardioides dongkuii]